MNDLPKRTLREHWNDPMFRMVLIVFFMFVLTMCVVGLVRMI